MRKTSGTIPSVKRAKRVPIIIEGPVLAEATAVICPIVDRHIFSEVYSGVLARKSFVIHGPYQSGKTSFY